VREVVAVVEDVAVREAVVVVDDPVGATAPEVLDLLAVDLVDVDRADVAETVDRSAVVAVRLLDERTTAIDVDAGAATWALGVIAEVGTEVGALVGEPTAADRPTARRACDVCSPEEPTTWGTTAAAATSSTPPVATPASTHRPRERAGWASTPSRISRRPIRSGRRGGADAVSRTWKRPASSRCAPSSTASSAGSGSPSLPFALTRNGGISPPGRYCFIDMSTSLAAGAQPSH
jgi:hypothetical protein